VQDETCYEVASEDYCKAGKNEQFFAEDAHTFVALRLMDGALRALRNTRLLLARNFVTILLMIFLPIILAYRVIV
jgi:hypothetical protein